MGETGWTCAVFSWVKLGGPGRCFPGRTWVDLGGVFLGELGRTGQTWADLSNTAFRRVSAASLSQTDPREVRPPLTQTGGEHVPWRRDPGRVHGARATFTDGRMLRLGPYPPPLIEISDPEELWTEKADAVPVLAKELDVTGVAFPEGLVEVCEAKVGSVQEHINAVLGFNTCRKLQAQAEGIFSEEMEQREELRERAGEALRAAAARRAEEKYAVAPTQTPSASVTTGTPSSSPSEVGSNGEEEAWDERRRVPREVPEDSWKDWMTSHYNEDWPPLSAPPGHFEPVHPAKAQAEYFQEQQMYDARYDQYLELQRYHQVLEKQQRDLQRLLQAYSAAGFSDQAALMSQYQLNQLAQLNEQRAQLLSRYNYLESASAASAADQEELPDFDEEDAKNEESKDAEAVRGWELPEVAMEV
eukprot:s1526_g11.t2